MKRATAYKRRDGWCLQALSETTVGIGMETPPNIRLDADVAPEVLGQAVFAALAGSIQGVPHPPVCELDDKFDPKLALAGVKTWAAFAKQARCVGILNDNQWITFEPWENKSAKDGFVPIHGREVRIPVDSSPAQIAAALQTATALCL